MKRLKWRTRPKVGAIPIADVIPEASEPGSIHGPSGFGQKILAARTELSRSSTAPRIPPIVIGIAVGVLVFTVALVIELLIHDISEQAVRDMIRGNLKRLARAAATTVDADLHETFHSPEQEITAAYRKAVRPLERFQNSDSEISYVYTCILRDKQVYFVLDPTPPGELTAGGLESKSHVMDPYPEASQELLNAFQYDFATADIKPYTDRWGSFISGYAPVKNDQGKTVAIVGIDLSSDDYLNRLGAIRGAFWNGIVVAALLALLSACAAASMQAKSVAIHREAEERDRKYRNQIALTLERVESALKIAEVSRNRFSDLFEGIPVSCLTFDREGRIFEWNTQATQTFSLEPQNMLEKEIQHVMGSDLFGPSEERLVRQVLNGQSFSDQVWSDGRRYFFVSGHPLFGPDGEITGGILAAVDISGQKAAEDRVQSQLEDLNFAHIELNSVNQQLQEANARLEELATTDMLTGLPNRRAFYEELRTAMADAERGSNLSLVQADIDYFKMFNDVYGHHAGDEVLVLFGKALQSTLRPSDFVARHGGEEFYVILHGADRAASEQIVERLRKAVSEIGSGYGKITASFGVAQWDVAITSDEQFMQLTDDALYAAKAKGRNCAVFSENLRKKAA